VAGGDRGDENYIDQASGCQQELKSAPVSGTEKCTTAPVET
jgi:hypothetical protein